MIQPIRIDRFFSFYIPILSTDMYADPSQVSPFVRFFVGCVSKVIKPNLKREWDEYSIYTQQILYFYFGESRAHGNQRPFILY